MQNKRLYQLLTDAYYGDGLFYGGRGLRRHPREEESNYRDRQALAYYLNYTGPIVNACANPVYRNEIRREYHDTALFSAFLDDVDRLGTDLQDFLRRAAKYAKLYGVVYVLVNNTESRGENIAASVANRQYPFLTLILPEQVEEWAHDDKGALSSITWVERVTGHDGQISETRHTWTDHEWYASGDNTNLQGTHGLGRVPIVRWCGRSTEPTDVLPTSEFISVAQTNYFLYQVCSWHTQILRDQAFSILTLPDVGEEDITVGTNNVLAYDPTSTHAPAFIAPSAAPCQMLTEHMDRLVREMYRMCDLESVVGVQENKSGVAKQWEFEKTNRRLADFAIQCEQAEYDIMTLYELWTGENLDYFCEYPRDFKINDVADSLADAKMALDLGLGDRLYRTEVGRKVLDAYMPNIEPDIYDQIIEEFGEENEDEVQERAYRDEVIDDTEDGTNHLRL